jgi:hypothetical protein
MIHTIALCSTLGLTTNHTLIIIWDWKKKVSVVSLFQRFSRLRNGDELTSLIFLLYLSPFYLCNQLDNVSGLMTENTETPRGGTAIPAPSSGLATYRSPSRANTFADRISALPGLWWLIGSISLWYEGCLHLNYVMNRGDLILERIYGKTLLEG